MAFGDTATLLDDFNRSNEGPPLSADWTSITNGLKVVSNTVAGNGSGVNNIEFYDVSTFGPDVEAHIIISSKGGTNQFCSVFARMTTLASGTMDGYEARATPASGTDTIALYRIDNGTATLLDSASVEFASNDKLGIECIGSAIKVYHYTGGAWVERCSATDATYGAAGYVGIAQGHTTGRLDDFFAGTVGGSTTKSVSDTPTVSISEGTPTLAGSSSNSDTPTVSLSETVVIAGFSSQSDTPTISISETSAILAGLSQSDNPTISISDLATVLAGLNQADNPTISISEAVGIVGSSTQSDTPTVGISESVSLTSYLIRSDNPTVTVDEVLAIAGSSSQSDTTVIGITDSATVVVVEFITGSDAPAISLVESAAIVVMISVSDSITVSTPEQAVGLMVNLSVTDTLATSISDSITSILSTLSVSDAPTIGLSESISLAINLFVADAPTVTIVDASGLIINQFISTSDTLAISIVDSSSISQEGQGILKELFLYPRSAELILSSRSSRLE